MPTGTFGRTKAGLARANAAATPAPAPAAAVPLDAAVPASSKGWTPGAAKTVAAVVPPSVPAISASAPVASVPEPEDVCTDVATTADRTPSRISEVEGMVGEWGARDAVLPYIKLGQRTSKVAEDNPAVVGVFLYDNSEIVGSNFTAIVTSMVKFFEEGVEFGSSEIPQRFETMDQVRAAGMGTADVKEVVLIDLFVRAENETQYERCTVVDDSDVGYYPARMAVRSSALTSVKGVIVRDLAGWLGGKLINGFYEFVSDKRTNPKGTYYVPVARPAGRVPKALANQLALVLGR